MHPVPKKEPQNHIQENKNARSPHKVSLKHIPSFSSGIHHPRLHSSFLIRKRAQYPFSPHHSYTAIRHTAATAIHGQTGYTTPLATQRTNLTTYAMGENLPSGRPAHIRQKTTAGNAYKSIMPKLYHNISYMSIALSAIYCKLIMNFDRIGIPNALC